MPKDLSTYESCKEYVSNEYYFTDKKTIDIAIELAGEDATEDDIHEAHQRVLKIIDEIEMGEE